ncbi:hypothetical protein, partial [Streptomyces sp. NPDC030920]|uniref:hypothetical protein n=1 Tax=Streptomyces sp. NPDC030920 TaxID=3365308 RepID=UPI00384E96E4
MILYEVVGRTNHLAASVVPGLTQAALDAAQYAILLALLFGLTSLLSKLGLRPVLRCLISPL